MAGFSMYILITANKKHVPEAFPEIVSAVQAGEIAEGRVPEDRTFSIQSERNPQNRQGRRRPTTESGPKPNIAAEAQTARDL